MKKSLRKAKLSQFVGRGNDGGWFLLDNQDCSASTEHSLKKRFTAGSVGADPRKNRGFFQAGSALFQMNLDEKNRPSANRKSAEDRRTNGCKPICRRNAWRPRYPLSSGTLWAEFSTAFSGPAYRSRPSKSILMPPIFVWTRESMP